MLSQRLSFLCKMKYLLSKFQNFLCNDPAMQNKRNQFKMFAPKKVFASQNMGPDFWDPRWDYFPAPDPSTLLEIDNPLNVETLYKMVVLVCTDDFDEDIFQRKGIVEATKWIGEVAKPLVSLSEKLIFRRCAVSNDGASMKFWNSCRAKFPYIPLIVSYEDTLTGEEFLAYDENTKRQAYVEGSEIEAFIATNLSRPNLQTNYSGQQNVQTRTPYADLIFANKNAVNYIICRLLQFPRDKYTMFNINLGSISIIKVYRSGDVEANSIGSCSHIAKEKEVEEED